MVQGYVLASPRPWGRPNKARKIQNDFPPKTQFACGTTSNHPLAFVDRWDLHRGFGPRPDAPHGGRLAQAHGPLLSRTLLGSARRADTATPDLRLATAESGALAVRARCVIQHRTVAHFALGVKGIGDTLAHKVRFGHSVEPTNKHFRRLF